MTIFIRSECLGSTDFQSKFLTCLFSILQSSPKPTSQNSFKEKKKNTLYKRVFKLSLTFSTQPFLITFKVEIAAPFYQCFLTIISRTVNTKYK
jgi:hypothetical protein